MVSWHFCNSAWYTSLCACSATFSYSRLFRSSLSNAIVASFSSMVCLWAWRSSSFVNSRAWTRFVRSSIFASNPRRCLLGRAPWAPCPCLFEILQWHTWPQRLRGIYPSCFDDVWVQTNPRAMGGCLYVISSRHFTFIQALHRHINMLEAQKFPTWACLNQFCSSLSTNTLISLMLNSSGFLLSLEAFNKEDIFICCSFFRPKHFCIWSSDTKKAYV